MSEIDWIIIAVFAVSTLVGLVRGVVREVLSIIGWIAGLMLALAFAGDLARMIPLRSLGLLPRVLIASVVLVVGTLFVVGLAGMLLRKLLRVAEISAEDRLFGGIFGFFRGMVIVCAAIFFFGMITSIKDSRPWQESVLVVPAETVIDWSLPYLPSWFQRVRSTQIELPGSSKIPRI